jgi:hypothetical protein
MFSNIRKRLTYANVAMTLALVFAMSGGAYAASKYVITSTKQIKPSVLKSLTGKTGPAGPAGPAGAAGAGTAGATGPGGAQGSAGTNGTNGEKGEIGKTGSTGPQGPAGILHPGETLPKGATETGDWEVRSTAAAAGEFKITVISFPIPLASNPAQTLFVKLGGPMPSGCKGSVAKPEAEPGGNLCLFEGEGFSVIHKGGLEYSGSTVNPIGGPEAAATGAQPVFTTLAPKTPGEEVSAEGTWAVTG